MNIQEANKTLRELFNNLIVNENVKKRHLCSLILGSQCEPQLDGFMNGRDFGIKPMEKIADSLGYDIELVFKKKPFKFKNDPPTHEELGLFDQYKIISAPYPIISDINQNFIDNSIKKIKTGLENPDLIRTGIVIEPGAIQSVTDDLFASIIGS
jgi:hypothetical protein